MIDRDHALLVFGTLGWLAFVIIETAGLSPKLPTWHTISFIAHQHAWLKLTIALVLTSLGPLFWLHASRIIAK